MTDRNGFITSPPGETVIRIECLPGSTLPSDMGALGYEVMPTGEGQRLLATAIVEKFVVNSRGKREPMTVGSTEPVASVVAHAGMIRVLRLSVPLSGATHFTVGYNQRNSRWLLWSREMVLEIGSDIAAMLSQRAACEQRVCVLWW